ncbi:hypothetical protein TCDM_03110 [Trypanosoma cruzi Dm28c]|uniref:Uncharacterized protein n=2 Tax=Trypanosoma cruzi TaxID=5693 RepID=V5BK49_TRYCR|nr:hypothetical protein TCDM_03110 [Trypanosoma cruzi Dm28c]KAF8306854.1 general transcription factor IIB [Trypanosoma cruzi]PWU94463.1 hypothetical protein C4B63_26g251 [Trypanosoma cruzi]
MATTADFLGKNCPHCGAIDSLETDDVLGEVACTECAIVVAMGLEESVSTRYDKDATYDDVDRHRKREDMSVSTPHALSLSSSASKTPGGDTTGKIILHPAMLNCIRGLQKKSALPEQVIGRAVELARRFVGGRRARGQRIEKQQDVAAACFMIAAEQMSHPVPLAELRHLDAALGDVEYRRAEIVKETQMEEEERRLKAMYVDNLLTIYLRKLSLQLSLYMPRCKRLFGVLHHVDSLSEVGVVDRIIMSLLLALTSRSFQWEKKTPVVNTTGNSVIGSTNSPEAICANFAAKANLDIGKVNKVMKTANENLQAILAAFAATDSTHGNENTKEEEKEEDNENSSNMTPVTKRMKVENP